MGRPLYKEPIQPNLIRVYSEPKPEADSINPYKKWTSFADFDPELDDWTGAEYEAFIEPNHPVRVEHPPSTEASLLREADSQTDVPAHVRLAPLSSASSSSSSSTESDEEDVPTLFDVVHNAPDVAPNRRSITLDAIRSYLARSDRYDYLDSRLEELQRQWGDGLDEPSSPVLQDFLDDFTAAAMDVEDLENARDLFAPIASQTEPQNTSSSVPFTRTAAIPIPVPNTPPSRRQEARQDSLIPSPAPPVTPRLYSWSRARRISLSTSASSGVGPERSPRSSIISASPGRLSNFTHSPRWTVAGRS